jgi:hypothetical protein
MCRRHTSSPGVVHPCRYNRQTRGYRASGIRAGKIDWFEILKRHIAYIVEAAPAMVKALQQQGVQLGLPQAGQGYL